MFAAESAADALAAFCTAAGIVHATVLCKASSAYTIATTIANKPHPFYWKLFATAVAGNHNVCHVLVVYSAIIKRSTIIITIRTQLLVFFVFFTKSPFSTRCTIVLFPIRPVFFHRNNIGRASGNMLSFTT